MASGFRKWRVRRGQTVVGVSRCLGCDSPVPFDEHRLRLYCDDTCRANVTRDHEWLVEEARKLGEELAFLPPRSRRATEVRVARRTVLWHLARLAPVSLDIEAYLDAQP